jgi:hypothetical protein
MNNLIKKKLVYVKLHTKTEDNLYLVSIIFSIYCKKYNYLGVNGVICSKDVIRR